jgi:ATP-binding cassette subfamily C (CFTR/MRP) protein 4
MGYYSPNSKTSKSDAIFYASIIIIASFINAVVGHSFVIHYLQIAIKVRVASSSLIYRKALTLSKKSLSRTTVGHIINLLSNDMQKVVKFWSVFNAIWATIPQAVIILYLLYFIAGPTALVGIVFVLILIPIQCRSMSFKPNKTTKIRILVFMSKKSAFYRLKIALKIDERIRYMNEIISGIQVIKIYTWEQPFVKPIDPIKR